MVWYDEKLMESPIEEMFIHDLCKFLKCEMIQQFWTKPKNNSYRIDLVLVHRGLKIAIELDGAQHDLKKDLIRDLEIIESRVVDIIIRFRGTDIYFNTWDLIRVLFEKFPILFDKDRIEHVIKCLCNKVISAENYKGDEYNYERYKLEYFTDEEVYDEEYEYYVNKKATREIIIKTISEYKTCEEPEKIQEEFAI